MRVQVVRFTDPWHDESTYRLYEDDGTVCVTWLPDEYPDPGGIDAGGFSTKRDADCFRLGIDVERALHGLIPGVTADDVDRQALDTLMEFVLTPGCLEAFGNEDLNGLPGNASIQPAGPNAGAAKHIGVVVCEAVQDCELCPAALSFGICGETCTPIP